VRPLCPAPTMIASYFMIGLWLRKIKARIN
jgi:hypothetical protein